MRFFKFREIRGELEKDYALEALLNSYAIFSGRKNFNNLFDSKIHIEQPTPEPVLAVLQDPNIGKHARTVRQWVASGAFTAEGLGATSKNEAALNELFDSYPIYSLSSRNDCHLLWAHYAASHTGFCVEFEFPGDQPTQVIYREHIETIPLLDFVKSQFGLLGADFGTRVHDALIVKSKCWDYEEEYRWIASNAMGRVPKGGKFIKVPYQRPWVKAVIFGCRMNTDAKNYIRKALPFNVEFKQATETIDHIEIVAFDEALHL